MARTKGPSRPGAPERRTAPSSARPTALGFRAATLVAAVLAAPVFALPTPTVTEVEVKVERVRPKREKRATLRFLKENRAFIRARIDQLRQAPTATRGEGGEIDPRYLAYQEMLAGILAAGDSVAVAEDARKRQELLASIAELGGLERRLDLMDRVMAEQRSRLRILQDDFTGHQQTALVIVVSGTPDAALTEIAITLEDGARLAVPLSTEERESLRHGGIVQIFHGFVEPRPQVIEIAIGGQSWPTGEAGYVTLDPARDRLTFLKLELSGVDAERGAGGIRASTWLNDAKPNPGEG